MPRKRIGIIMKNRKIFDKLNSVFNIINPPKNKERHKYRSPIRAIKKFCHYCKIDKRQAIEMSFYTLSVTGRLLGLAVPTMLFVIFLLGVKSFVSFNNDTLMIRAVNDVNSIGSPISCISKNFNSEKCLEGIKERRKITKDPKRIELIEHLSSKDSNEGYATFIIKVAKFDLLNNDKINDEDKARRTEVYNKTIEKIQGEKDKFNNTINLILYFNIGLIVVFIGLSMYGTYRYRRNLEQFYDLRSKSQNDLIKNMEKIFFDSEYVEEADLFDGECIYTSKRK